MATVMKKITATGVVYTGRAFVKSVVLTPAAALSTLLVQDSTDGSKADVLALQAGASGVSTPWVSGDASGDGNGPEFALGIYGTLSGAGASASFEYEPMS